MKTLVKVLKACAVPFLFIKEILQYMCILLAVLFIFLAGITELPGDGFEEY
jgi:hypothetical protein